MAKNKPNKKIHAAIVLIDAKENKKFLYQVAKDGARAREYEDAIDWLNNSNIVSKIFNVTKPDFPLNARPCFCVHLSPSLFLHRLHNPANC